VRPSLYVDGHSPLGHDIRAGESGTRPAGNGRRCRSDVSGPLKPIVDGTDEGIWRRLRLVPWDVVIPVPERDLTLSDQLALEAGAVLAWLVAGYLDWHGHGLTDPEQVTKATAAYKAESNALGRFIGQRCLTGPHFHVWSAELFAAWAEWCRAEGEDPGTQTAFSLALTNRGFDKRPTKAANVWTGLGPMSRHATAGWRVWMVYRLAAHTRVTQCCKPSATNPPQPSTLRPTGDLDGPQDLQDMRCAGRACQPRLTRRRAATRRRWPRRRSPRPR
jgi:hypothetical protein